MNSNRSILLALLLAGCSQSYTEPALSGDHPANPRATVAPLPERSDTLAMPAAARAPMPGAGPDHGTHGHAAADDHTPPESGRADATTGAAVYTCPMHPAVVSDEPGRCPECHMKLVPKAAEEEKEGGQ